MEAGSNFNISKVLIEMWQPYNDWLPSIWVTIDIVCYSVIKLGDISSEHIQLSTQHDVHDQRGNNIIQPVLQISTIHPDSSHWWDVSGGYDGCSPHSIREK